MVMRGGSLYIHLDIEFPGQEAAGQVEKPQASDSQLPCIYCV